MACELLELRGPSCKHMPVLAKQIESIAIPKRFSQVIRDIWLMQHRLVSRRGRNLLSVLQHPRFRAAYDFLLLRAAIGEVKQSTADWWTEIQTVDFEQQKKMLADIAPKHRRRRKPRKKQVHKQSNNNQQAGDS